MPGTGQRNRKRASSGADFGFWRPSAREERRRLGGFRGHGRFIGVKSTQRTIHAHIRTRTHTRTHTHTHTPTHTRRHRLTRTAVQGAPIRRIRPPQSILILTCCARRTESPNPAYFGWRQEMRARDSSHSAASAGLLATAWRACKPWISSCDAHGMWLRSGGGCLSPGEPPPSGVSVRHHLHIVRSDRGHSPEGRPLAACRCLRVHSASLLTRGLRHVRGRPREHCRVTVTRSQVVEPPMCSVPVHRRLGMGLPGH